jgi:glycosyltransferase involved in cell wall biosynthesis
MNKKICMIAYSIFPYDARIRREAETLAMHGSKVNFIVLCEKERPVRYQSNGVNVIEIAVRKYRGKKKLSYLFSYLRFLILAFFVCTRLFIKGQVDVVHVHNMPDFLILAAVVPRLLGKKVVLDIHDSMPETYRGKTGSLSIILHRLLCLEERLCSLFAHRVVCVNEVQKEVLLKRGMPPEKITVLLNVPDHRIFKFRHRKAELSDLAKSEFSVVYHGTIDRMLGIDLAIETVSRLNGEIPGIRLYILGLGKDLNEFIALSRKLGVEGRVYFSQKNYPVERLPAILSTMDLGIIPNRKNMTTDLMLPVKLLEYIAIGIPVVVPRLKTIERYFSNEAVSYFEPGNAESMAVAILQLYNNQDKRQNQVVNARKFIETYGWEKHQMELIRLYEEL